MYEHFHQSHALDSKHGERFRIVRTSRPLDRRPISIRVRTLACTATASSAPHPIQRRSLVDGSRQACSGHPHLIRVASFMSG
jgi:hypothetical protein